MTTGPTTRLRLNKQVTGSNVNTHGTVLNDEVFDMADEAIAGVKTLALTGAKTLTATNYVTDEARSFALRFTGTLGTPTEITIPNSEKVYFVINDTDSTLQFKISGGATADVESGRRKTIACDGTTVYVGDDGADKEYVDAADALKLSLTGGTVSGLVNYATDLSGTYTDRSLVDKAYVNAVALGSVSVSFAWADVTGKPTTIAGFGITDALTSTQIAAAYQPLDSDLTALAAVSGQTAAGREQLVRTRRYVATGDSPVTAAYGDEIICDSSGGAIEIDLPAAAVDKAPIIIKAGADAATNNITIDPDGSDTVLGQSNLVINQNFFAWEFSAKAGAWD